MNLYWSGAAPRPCSWCVRSFWMCVLRTAPRGVRFPRMGLGSLLHCAAVGARCPRNDTGVLGIGGTEPTRAGEPETFSFTNKVNMSPDSNNIFSQPQKRQQRAHQTSRRAWTRQDEPVRRRNAAAATARREKRCPKSNSGLHFGFEASNFAAGLVPGKQHSNMTDAQSASTSHSNTPPSATREVSSESTPPRPPPAPRPIRSPRSLLENRIVRPGMELPCLHGFEPVLPSLALAERRRNQTEISILV